MATVREQFASSSRTMFASSVDIFAIVLKRMVNSVRSEGATSKGLFASSEFTTGRELFASCNVHAMPSLLANSFGGGWNQ